MQRAANREDTNKNEEEVIPDGNLPSSVTPKRCVVIVEGDPQPGARKGRMSFQGFNSSLDKLNEEATTSCQLEASTTGSGNGNGKLANRGAASKEDGLETKLNSLHIDANEELKRKRPKEASGTHNSNKSPKLVRGDQDALLSNGRSFQKQAKYKKLDCSVRPPKSQKKRAPVVM
ncbi:hypothetical protein NMG60_11034076 [Bertholletia excelsa]